MVGCIDRVVYHHQQEENLWQTMAFVDFPDIDGGMAMAGADPIDDSVAGGKEAAAACVLQNRSEDVWVDLADRSTWYDAFELL